MRQNYVVGFAFSEDREEVVLIRKNRPAWQAGKLNGVGGKFEADKDADMVACMCREFSEETGVETVPDDWHYYTKVVGRDGDVYFYRMFDDKALTAQTKSDEPVEITAVDFAHIRAEGLSNLVWLIGIALDETQPGFFVEANYNQEFKTGRFGTDTPAP